MSIDVTVNFEKKFSHRAMQILMAYSTTYNCETQAVAATDADFDSTGTKSCMINGQPEVLEVEDDMDLGTMTDGTWTAWVTATAYTVGQVRDNDDGHPYRCIVAHTSECANEPGVGDRWAEKWEPVMHTAVNSAGTVIQDDYAQWFLITATADGALQSWEAGDETAITSTAVCKIPLFDYKVYCPVALVHIQNETGGDFTHGTTSMAAANVTSTVSQIIGPVYPHPDNWDKN